MEIGDNVVQIKEFCTYESQYIVIKVDVRIWFQMLIDLRSLETLQLQINAFDHSCLFYQNQLTIIDIVTCFVKNHITIPNT